MRIHRSRLGGHFTQIPNETLRDDRLSYIARGVLCELLSRPDEWDVTADGIAAAAQSRRARVGEGRRAMRGVFAELVAAGYLVRVKSRGTDGRVVTGLHLYDRPCTDVPDGGTSVPPAETDVCPGRTDVPPTDVPDGGTSNRTLSTNTEEHGPKDLASRRARADRAGAERNVQTIIREVKAAVAEIHGEREAICLSDEEALGLYCSHVTGDARAGIRDLAAYMAKILGDAPYLDTFLANSEPVCVACVRWEDECRCPAA